MRITAEDIREAGYFHIMKDYTSLSEYFDYFLVPTILESEFVQGEHFARFHKDTLSKNLAKFNESIPELILFLKDRGFDVTESMNKQFLIFSWKKEEEEF